MALKFYELQRQKGDGIRWVDQTGYPYKLLYILRIFEHLLCWQTFSSINLLIPLINGQIVLKDSNLNTGDKAQVSGHCRWQTSLIVVVGIELASNQGLDDIKRRERLEEGAGKCSSLFSASSSFSPTPVLLHVKNFDFSFYGFVLVWKVITLHYWLLKFTQTLLITRQNWNSKSTKLGSWPIQGKNVLLIIADDLRPNLNSYLPTPSFRWSSTYHQISISNIKYRISNIIPANSLV